MTSFSLYKIAAAHILYLALFGAGFWFYLRRSGADLGAFDAVICSLPALFACALACTSTADQEQYLLRLLAAALFAPILLLFWRTDNGLSLLQQAGPALLHALCLVGAILWLGTRTTVVEPPTGASAVDIATLHARLLSLNASGAPLQVSSPAPSELVVRFLYRSPQRSYRLLLYLDASSHQVRVRERASANLATPANENEKSLRGPGEAAFDPTRPDAQAVWETVLQVTPIRPADLTAMRASLPLSPELAAALDEKGVATLLCTVITSSGWRWQPAWFGAQ